ncbi:PPE domain-containing protein [Nocardia sp. NPDC003693]
MALHVDPWELAGLATRLDALARALHGALPGGWVRPAGADSNSVIAAAHYNGLAQRTLNGVIGLLNEVAPQAYNIGASAADYTLADEEGGRALGAAGAPILTNPIAAPARFAARGAPPAPAAPGGAVDSLTFARQLQAGPGPGPARAYADSVRGFLTGAHAAALRGIDSTVPALRNWTPVGTGVAERLTVQRGRLERLGGSLGALAAAVDGYADAFESARAKHPTPQEIIAARRRLLTAMRSKNALAIEAALAEFTEQNARSAQTITDYTARVGATGATDPGDRPDGKPVGEKGDGEKGDGETGDKDNGDKDNGSGGSGGGGTGSEAAMLSQLLPTLMSALTNANGQLSPDESPLDDGGYGDEFLEDLPMIPSFDGGGGGGGPGFDPGVPGGGNPVYPVGQLPTVGAPGTVASGLPRTPVIDPLQNSGAGAGANRAAMMPHMPYMPMAPGMPGAGAGAGNDRSRVVAWHPDRLMYVDDTPFTEAVIGEKPSIAPAVTPPTPPLPNPAPTNPGGSV